MPTPCDLTPVPRACGLSSSTVGRWTAGERLRRLHPSVLALGRAGSTRLRRVLADRHPDAHHTRSRWKAAMLRMIDEHGLPRPQVDASLPAVGVEADLLWPDRMLVVEWDSWEHHRLRGRFESDRRKTLALQSAGDTVLRLTWRQTKHARAEVVGHLRAALARADGHPARGAGRMSIDAG